MNQNFPVIETAKLPGAYLAAKTALAACAKMDELKEWSDKAATLASYARMADDKELENLATRIRARAIRRMGDLLKEIEPSAGGRPSKTSTGGDTSLTRKQAASDAGLSKRQMNTSLRVSNVPEAEFEDQVESDNPPRIPTLAKRGTKKRKTKIIDHTNGRDPKEFNRALHFTAAFRNVADNLDGLDVEADAAILTIEEVGKIDANINRALKRIDEIRRIMKLC